MQEFVLTAAPPSVCPAIVIFHHSYWEMQPCGVFVPSQHASKNMSNDPAACKIALFSLFQTVIIEYF